MSDPTSGGDGEPSENGDEAASSDDEGPSTEEEIRGAAYGVLVEEGYDALTTQAVADAAGVSQSLVHYYYETKEDLVFAVFANGLDYLADQVASRVDADDPRERLLELARATLRGEDTADYDQAVDMSRLILEIEAQAPYDDRLAETIQFDNWYLRDYVADAVREGIEAGQFREVDPEVFAATYVAAIRGGQNWRAVFADDEWTAPVLAGLEAMVEEYLVAEGPA